MGQLRHEQMNKCYSFNEWWVSGITWGNYACVIWAGMWWAWRLDGTGWEHCGSPWLWLLSWTLVWSCSGAPNWQYGVIWPSNQEVNLSFFFFSFFFLFLLVSWLQLCVHLLRQGLWREKALKQYRVRDISGSLGGGQRQLCRRYRGGLKQQLHRWYKYKRFYFKWLGYKLEHLVLISHLHWKCATDFRWVTLQLWYFYSLVWAWKFVENMDLSMILWCPHLVISGFTQDISCAILWSILV